VIAIANDIYTNVARQWIHGVDLSSDYRLDWRSSTITFMGQASWERSYQQNSDLQPVFQLAGTVFNPPRVRARTGATWRYSDWTTSAFVNYVGGVVDDRTAPYISGGSMTTIDLAVLYKNSSGPRILHDLTLSLAVTNLTDRAPPYLTPTAPSIVNYDSTNYSPLGRFITFSVAKHW
jgi:iron complex outermembrane recepter protein